MVFPLFLMENNFHHRRHRKVAMRQTLPNSQMSLSLRKFSMMTTLLFLFPVCFLFQPLCLLWQRSFRWWAAMLTWHRTASIDYLKYWSAGFFCCALNAQSLALYSLGQEKGSVLSSHLPTQPTIHPPPGFFPASHPRT